MKSDTSPDKSPAPEKKSEPRRRRTQSPRKSIENRDLNSEEDQRTNASRDPDWDTKTTDNRTGNDTTVEDEADREVRRKQEGSHPEEFQK